MQIIGILFALLLALGLGNAHAVTDAIITTGASTWTAPPGVTSVTVEAWGAGGGGGSAITTATTKGGGGGGGGYSKKINIPVTAGVGYAVTVGVGGLAGTTANAAPGNGGSSTFAASTVVANGGNGGTNSTAPGVGGALGAGGTAGTGDAGSTFRGGNGSAGGGTTGGAGGAASGSGGITGIDASGNTAGTGIAPSGSGGAGRTTRGAGNAGVAIGGGGGGGYKNNGTNQAGGAGARGEVRITYTAATVIADGTNPGNVTLAPGGAITDLDAFTLVTSSGADSVTALTVTLTGTNAFQALSQVSVTNSAGTTTYFTAVANPASNTINFSGGTPIPVSAAVATFKIRVTPKTHVNINTVSPPPGVTYAIGGTVTAFTSTNVQSGADGASATVTVDNLSPNSATGATGTAGPANVTLNWTTSSSPDFATTSGSVVYRWATTAGAQTPTEGVIPAINTTNGTATVACVTTTAAASTLVTAINGTGGTNGCSTTALVNGTAYYYKIFQKDANGNYDAGSATIGPYTPFITTTLATSATDPAAATIAPGAAATDVNQFTFATNNATETINSITVNLSTASGIGRLSITNNANTELGFTTTPVAGSNVIALTTNITATTTVTTYKVRITPLSHAAMPLPAVGTAYAITAPVTAWGGTNAQIVHAGSDTNANALTIDNLSPTAATATGGTPANANVALTWTTSASTDFNATSGSVVYRWQSATAGSEVPVEGSTPTINTTNLTATVACVVSSARSTVINATNGTGGGGGCSTTALTNNLPYIYKVFQKDTNGNYDTGTTFGPYTPNTTTTLATGTDPAATTIAPGAAATDVNQFTFQTNTGTETITSVTVNLSTNSGVGRLAITNSANTELGFTTTPVSGSNVITLTTNITAATAIATYKVRVTPLSHAAMPAVPGAAYAITAPVTAWAGTYTHAGSDTNTNALTIDNLSPSGATTPGGAAGNAAVNLNWTTSASADFSTTSGSVVYRWATTVGAQVPTEGTTPVVGTTNGTATVACVISSAGPSTVVNAIDGTGASAGCSATALTNGTTYIYKVFQKDANGNYDVGVSLGSYTPGSVATQLAFVQQPVNTAAGNTITPPVTVQVRDAGGTLVGTSTATVSLAISANPGGGTLTNLPGTLSVTASSGLATFSNLKIDKIGTGYTVVATSAGLTSATSNTFNITAGTATQLVFMQQPSNAYISVAVNPAITVQVQDANGNVVTTDNTTSVTLSKSCGGGITGNTVTASAGVATFSNLKIDALATGCTLTANSTPTLTPSTSISFDISALPASKLSFSVQPTNAAPSTAISPAIKVRIEDANGLLISSSAIVTLAIGNNAGGGVLGGTTSVAAVGGVATFSNSTINSDGTGYTLIASSSGLTGATSSAFNISSATQLQFYIPPSTTPASSDISPAVTVRILNASNGLVTTSTDAVKIVIGSGSGTLSVNGVPTATGVTVNAVGGVATFNGLSIDQAGDYTLVATATPLTSLLSVTSATFTITALDCYTENFSTLTNWSVGKQSGTFTPAIVTFAPNPSRLRLTLAASTNSSTWASLNKVFPGAGNKVIAEFDHFAYGGTSGDGIAMILSDASISPVAGAFGGSLGYAQKGYTPVSDCTTVGGCPGFAGGWLGIALDEYGNFETSTEGRVGGASTTRVPQTVSIRGSGSGMSGYRYLKGTSTLSTAVDGNSAANPAHRYRLTVDHRDGVHAWVSVERDTSGGGTTYTTLLGDTNCANTVTANCFDVKDPLYSQNAVPTNWNFAFTGSSGASTNTHEIRSVKICTVKPQVTPVLDHVRLEYSSAACTGNNTTVTVKACADSACSSLYPGTVSPTLTATATALWSNSLSSISPTMAGGQGTATLSDANAQSVTLSATAGAASVLCYDGATEGSCASKPITFSACVFDVIETGAAALTPIYTKLSGTAFNLDVLSRSVSAQTVNTVEIVNAASGGSCSAFPLVAASSTAVPSNFTAGQRKAFTFSFADAVRNARVRVGYVPNPNPTNIATQYSCSYDNFAIRPTTFTLTSSDANAASNVLKAGQTFAFTATARPGYDGIPKLDGTKLTPSPAVTPVTLGAVTFLAADSLTGATTKSGFTYSEVGTFTLTANGVYDDGFAAVDSTKTNPECTSDFSGTLVNGRYGCMFGNTLSVGPFGRFTPDHFDLTNGTLINRSDINAGAGCSPQSTYTYMGEPMRASFVLTAKNANGDTTQNYTGANAKFSSPVWTTYGSNNTIGLRGIASNYTYSSGVTCSVLFDSSTPSVNPLASCSDSQAHTLAVTARAAGPRVSVTSPTLSAWTYNTVSGAAQFTADVTLQRADLPDGPYDLFYVGVAPKDSDGVGLAASAFNLDADSTGGSERARLGVTKLRFGALKIDNATGPASLNMPVPVRTQYYAYGQTPDWLDNVDDACTPLAANTLKIGSVVKPGSSALAFSTPATGVSIVQTSGGRWTMTLTPATRGDGTADILFNLGGTVTTTGCRTLTGTTLGGAAPASSLDYLADNCGSGSYNRSSTASIRFGTNKSIFIYRREKF